MENFRWGQKYVFMLPRLMTIPDANETLVSGHIPSLHAVDTSGIHFLIVTIRKRLSQNVLAAALSMEELLSKHQLTIKLPQVEDLSPVQQRCQSSQKWGAACSVKGG